VTDFDKHFDDLEAQTSPAPTAPTPPREPLPAEGAPPKDPVTGKFLPRAAKTDPAPKAPEKPAAPAPAKPAEPVDEGFEPPGTGTMTQVRGWAIRAGKRLAKAQQEMEQLKTQVQELRNGNGGADVKALTEELASTKKQLADYDNEIRLTRYERSNEYKEKYQKPYDNAVAQAYAEVKELIVYEPPAEEGQPPRERQATPADFDEIYSLPLGAATKVAKQKFGDASFIVLQHRNAIKNAAKSALGAIEEHKTKGADFEQQQTAQQKMEQEGRDRMFSQAIEALTQKFPEYFGERDNDSEWNEHRTKGQQLADLAFSDRKGLTPAQSSILDAQVYARLVGFPPLMHDYIKVKSELEKATKELEEIRKSAPGKPDTNGSAGAPVARKSWDAEFDERVKL
jgi:hypothetical protein